MDGAIEAKLIAGATFVATLLCVKVLFRVVSGLGLFVCLLLFYR